MASKKLLFGLVFLLLLSPFLVVATPTSGLLRLPTTLVTMNVVYGTNSYFDLTLNDIPPGYDLINGTYPGWCVQKNMIMTQQVNHTVQLYDSTSDILPKEYQTIHWECINYLLNHRVGNRSSMQHAIWYFTDDFDCSNDSDAYGMIIDAEIHGQSFYPAPGQRIAVPIIGVPTIQFTFLETLLPPLATIDGFVWDDLNRNGLQDPGEPGKNNIRIYLSTANNTLMNATLTTDAGTYQFANISPGSYYLTIVAPSGYHFSPTNIGSDDSLDSDVDSTGRTPFFVINTIQASQTWDAGLYTTTIRHPPSSINHKPTADGTAGEPYQGFINQPILFNGSRSYDRDGHIISYLWSYGDGATQTGAVTTHTYTSPGEYPVSLTITDDDYASDTYITIASITQGNNPPGSPTIIGPHRGHANTLYEYITVAADMDNDTIRYILLWDDNHTTTTPYHPSGQPITLSHQWTSYGFYVIQAYTQDENNATSAIIQLHVAIDVCSIGSYGYLIDTNSDGIYDFFFSNSTHQQNQVEHLDTGEYLIDTNNDGIWDIVYNPTTDQYTTYTAIPLIEYLLLILLIVALVLLVYLLRVRRQTRTLSSTRKNKP